MQNYNWQLDNFALGMHTEPAKTQGGERYAGEIQNLRIDSDGWLRERSKIVAVGSTGTQQNITGIAATPKHVFVLRADGKLYIRERDDLDTETEITGVSDLDGRISVVDFNTYIILTSEGTDQGYMVDLREGENYQNIQLGLDAPDPIAAPDSLGVTLVHSVPSGAESSGDGDLSDGSYIYTYAYLLNDDDDELPWNNMQSDLWAVWGESVTTSPSEDINYARVAIAYSDNIYATHIRIYRAHINDQYNLKQVADLPITSSGTLIFYDGYSDNEIDDVDKERRVSDQNLIVNRRFKTNERLPSRS